jgi:glutathione gamma-glutamylcysteinyltransferase
VVHWASRMEPVPQVPLSVYKRHLPEGCVAFSSAEGRALFREALAQGTMENFFPLIEQFHTQAEPAFCGLGTLVMVLNALAIDPGRTWKGPWRWYSEEHLDCCRPLDAVAREGITLNQLACLARCNGAKADVRFAEDCGLEAFRAAVNETTSSVGNMHIVVAYDRATLGQTGSGHFSPIGGMNAGRDLALVLDVARFKYPPHWVPLEALYRAMLPVDTASGRSRGFVQIQRERAVAPVIARREAADLIDIGRWLQDLDGTDLLVLSGCLESPESPSQRIIEMLRNPNEAPEELRPQLERLRTQIAALQASPRAQ